jgi:hypothetical protein
MEMVFSFDDDVRRSDFISENWMFTGSYFTAA